MRVAVEDRETVGDLRFLICWLTNKSFMVYWFIDINKRKDYTSGKKAYRID